MRSVHLPASTRSEAAKWNFPLGIEGLRFADLNRVRKLAGLDDVFLAELRRIDPELRERFESQRRAAAAGKCDHEPATSELLVAVGRHIDGFIAGVFGIQSEVDALNRQALEDRAVFVAKKKFVDRFVLKEAPAAGELDGMDVPQLEFRFREIVAEVLPQGEFADDPERELAEVVVRLLDGRERARSAGDEPAAGRCEVRLDQVAAWTRVLAFHPALGQRRRAFAAILFQPERLDFDELVPRRRPDPRLPLLFEGYEESHRCRDGFGLTDPRMSAREALGQMHYCIICHPRAKDSCSRGLFEKDGGRKHNPLGVPLTGCPLDEKISEAHLLKREGHSIGALAMIMADNPLCAGTGHRICNDCMKACIYQKQTPVDIPQIETSILSDVLRLPYGFEIYSLLTRWNPLNVRRPYPLPYNGINVLVVGMGPAGYTLAHHLLNEGFGVVGIEGLKVEPLSVRMRGAKRRVPQPIRDIADITGPLDERIILGFGGVSEYGITVRWDKNFLDINYLVLMRRKKFRMYDGVRFGGTITIDDAWRLGFHHIALATGAGRPTLVPMKNNLIRGVRQASDFLMGLQATGTYKRDSLGNLQVRLPAVVIGGGLTAIDAATEFQAYYVVHAEKTLDRYERLVSRIGEEAVRARFDGEEWQILNEWLRHGRALRAERSAARAAGRPPDFHRLIEGWGGVRIVYRKRLQDSPAYRLNHEEVIKCLEEGIQFVERASPLECIPDEDGAVRAVRFEVADLVEGRWRSTSETIEIPARSVLVAAGTSPNSTYEKEYPGSIRRDQWEDFYLGHELRVEDGRRRLAPVAPAGTALAGGGGKVGFFTSYESAGRYITYFGDNHPEYFGNVVKAMASAKDGFPEIVRLFGQDIAGLRPEDQPQRELDWILFAEALDRELTAEVVDAMRLTPNIVEVIVRAPLAARNFRPGQFYRLQNYDTYAEEVLGFRLSMEGVALTGAWVDPERGLISLIVLEMGGSSRLCALLEPGEKVVLMGPTGTPTEIPQGQTVLLAGGGLGNAVLFSIAKAAKERGNRVVYFAAYRSARDLFKRADIEGACDVVVWSADTEPVIEARRPQDRTLCGNIVQAIEAYGSGRLGRQAVSLAEVNRVIAIGSDRMMAAVKDALAGPLEHLFPKRPVAIGSINSPMQCMMKEICAQCLQRHVDPRTGEESFVFSCNNQDQLLAQVDFGHLSQRLRQNSAAEKLTSLWIDHLFAARMVQEV